MSTDIVGRIRSLEACDRLLLLLTAAGLVAGIPANYVRVHHPTSGAMLLWFLQAAVLWAAVAGVVVYSVIKNRRRPADYGISFQRGGLVSLAIIAVVHIYLAARGKLALDDTEALFLRTLAVFMEELMIRSIAIDKLMLLMHGIRHRVFWAILVSSAAWSVPHITSKPLSQVVGIFIAGLLFGYVYYKSRSILLPAWIHSVANAGYAGGLLLMAMYGVIAIADSALGYRHRQGSRVAAASGNA